MYFCIGILIIICIICFYLFLYKKKCAIKKVCCLRQQEKCEILCSLIEPMGFAYDQDQDIFTSKIDAWQHHYGYQAFFDHTAPLFQMVFDCEPVYFDYAGQTWMIEFWKGQYGINTGSEIGIYKADTIVPPSQREYVLFHAVKEEEMLPLSITLYYKQQPLFSLSKCHWWLTGFCMGLFSEPKMLQMTISITFPNCEMLCAFTNALRKNGYCRKTFCINDRTVTFCFNNPKTEQPGHCFKLYSVIAQWKNNLFCKLYNHVTHPFCNNIDRLLYLYYFLPFAFRKMITIRKPRRRRRKRT